MNQSIIPLKLRIIHHYFPYNVVTRLTLIILEKVLKNCYPSLFVTRLTDHTRNIILEKQQYTVLPPRSVDANITVNTVLVKKAKYCELFAFEERRVTVKHRNE